MVGPHPCTLDAQECELSLTINICCRELRRKHDRAAAVCRERVAECCLGGVEQGVLTAVAVKEGVVDRDSGAV